MEKKLFWQKSEPRGKTQPKAFEERMPSAMINERDEKASYKGYFFILKL